MSFFIHATSFPTKTAEAMSFAKLSIKVLAKLDWDGAARTLVHMAFFVGLKAIVANRRTYPGARQSRT